MQASLDAIAADLDNVYWMTIGAVGDGSDGAGFSKAKRGGSIVSIAAMQHDATGTGISIAASGGKVFWEPRGLGNADGAVRSAPGAGAGPITELASNQVRPQGIAADSSLVYWLDAGNGTDGLLQRASLTTKVITQLAGRLANPGDLGLDGAVLYFGTQGSDNPLISGGGFIDWSGNMGTQGVARIPAPPAGGVRSSRGAALAVERLMEAQSLARADAVRSCGDPDRHLQDQGW